MDWLVSLLVLSFLIFFHELGHFLAARLFGVHVEVFSIGFGKRLLSRRWGGTEYRLSAIPLGMKGLDDTDPKKRIDAPDSYSTKRPWQRIAILFAGPGFNFLLAFLLYLAVALTGMRALAPVIGTTLEGSAALEAGLQEGDRIVMINDTPVKSWEQISHAVAQYDGPMQILFERDGTQTAVILTPRIGETQTIFGEAIRKKLIGISPAGEITTLTYAPFEAVDVAWEKTLQAATLIVTSIEKLVVGAISTDSIGGVISIVQITSEASAIGISALLILTALISVNLGVLNLLPIPALDGGHILFTLYEMVTRRTPSQETLYRLTLGGWILLGMLMALGLYNDIHRLMIGGTHEP